jgi:hypothetical protein
MFLTPAGQAAGFTLSTFADQFPNFADVGPLAALFPGNGHVLVTGNGPVYDFPSDQDGQSALTTPIAQDYGLSNAIGLAQEGGSIYMTQQANSSVVRINSDGRFNSLLVSGLTFATGIAVNPSNGHLFVSNTVQVFDVDPISQTFQLFANENIDQMTFNATGSIVYGADIVTSHVLGFDTTTGAIVFDSGFIFGDTDGLALGQGPLAGNLFVNTHAGTVIEVNLNSLAQTTIAEGGSRGDFISPDPNGSFLLAQTDSLLRLGLANNPVPEPTSLMLTTVGCIGLLGAAWRRRLRAHKPNADI